MSAATTVFAIGAKMRPSTRWSMKIGRYAAMMMRSENTVGRTTDCVRALDALVQPIAVAASLRAVAGERDQDALDDDDAAVDDDAEVDRAHREQVRATCRASFR